jgi:hypothetical protein
VTQQLASSDSAVLALAAVAFFTSAVAGQLVVAPGPRSLSAAAS